MLPTTITKRVYGFTRRFINLVFSNPQSIKAMNSHAITMTTQEAKVAYGALTDVAHMLIHNDKFSDDALLARLRTLAIAHGMTLHKLSEHKIYDILPPHIQKEFDKIEPVV
eukprot:Phypoly_transcript_28258.p1 GENE.Phypoly_transcript_28258~~Phypoly_transcript_28258.p1  ORF type:complete len:111 (+),score=12.79 Phypoly_transcript_28258:3-335(+)